MTRAVAKVHDDECMYLCCNIYGRCVKCGMLRPLCRMNEVDGTNDVVCKACGLAGDDEWKEGQGDG